MNVQFRLKETVRKCTIWLQRDLFKPLLTSPAAWCFATVWAAAAIYLIAVGGSAKVCLFAILMVLCVITTEITRAKHKRKLNRHYYREYQSLLNRVSNLETAVDCLINRPKWTESEEIGFNGQRHRKIIFQDLLKAFNFVAVLETGTWIGNTAGYMAKTSNLPVYTCELNECYYSLAKMRLQDIPNITLVLGDSRSFLKSMSNKDISKKTVFIYLDAHGYKDLPLREEIEIVCSTWRDFVIMIDDFQVPGDNGYVYDDYGKKKKLSLEDFSDTFSKHGLVPFFPAISSAEETGLKQGCVVLARKGQFSEILNSLQSLCAKGF